jgi:DNA-binding LacI/PurR family transcriptional regulator
MQPLRVLSAAEQVAAHLRRELERGHWVERLPGAVALAAELGVNRKTVEAALQQLEKEAYLQGQGPGRKRRIVASRVRAGRQLRIGLLDYDRAGFSEGYMVELQHSLIAAGNAAFFAEKCLLELGMDVARVSRYVRQTKADAWVIGAGSREVLAWFSAQPTPAFALFGRRESLPIAGVGPDKRPAYVEATRQLIGLGHRRIVLVARRERRLPEPGRPERASLEELKAHGVPVGAFNLPDWEETPEGFRKLLRSLFQVTPPTALIIDEVPLFAAAQQFLAESGIRVPQRVSLICSDDDPTFAWCLPTIAHIRWDPAPVVRRIVRWATAVSRGLKDVEQTLTQAEFITGGTTGPAPAD